MNKPKNMQTKTQIIAREGYKPILSCIVFMFICIFFHWEFLALLLFIIIVFCCFVFRNSERIAESRANNAIISPCDGIIKDISKSDSSVSILIKINIFDVGIFRVPATITNIKSEFKYGLFIKDDKYLQSILNTKHKVSGFYNKDAIFSITLLPEAWNKANIYEINTNDKGDSKKAKSKTLQDSTIFIGDRLGFMKYGYVILEIKKPCMLKVDKGDSVFAGETLLGKLRGEL